MVGNGETLTRLINKLVEKGGRDLTIGNFADLSCIAQYIGLNITLSGSLVNDDLAEHIELLENLRTIDDCFDYKIDYRKKRLDTKLTETKSQEQSSIIQRKEQIQEKTQLLEQKPSLVQKPKIKRTKIEKSKFIKKRDKEQSRIINQPPNKYLIVKARPGAGKTYTLLKRLEYLINENQLVELNQLLILSYSNAAVNELKNRIKGIPTLSRYVNNIEISTIHSFTYTHLLDVEDDVLETHREKYEEYVSKFDITLDLIIHDLKEGYMDDDVFRDRIVLIDEIQDIQSIAADFVRILGEKIIEIGTGFTLFGDPYQSIFQFIRKDNPISETRFEDLFRELIKRRETNLLELTYIERTRGHPKQINLTQRLFDIMDDIKISYMEKFSMVKNVVRGLDDLNIYSDDIDLFLERNDEVAVLSYTNAQTINIFQQLAREGKNASITDSKMNQYLNTGFYWLEKLFLESNNGVFTEIDLGKLKNHFGFISYQDFIQEIIEFTEVENLVELSWSDFKEKLSIASKNPKKAYIPDMFLETNENIVLSTVHKAKGKEFDIVVFNPGKLASARKKIDEEEKAMEICHVIYVALTRAKRQTFKLPIIRGHDPPISISPKGKKIWDSYNEIERHAWGSAQNNYFSNSKIFQFDWKTDFEFLTEKTKYFDKLTDLKNGDAIKIEYFNPENPIGIFHYSERGRRLIGYLNHKTEKFICIEFEMNRETIYFDNLYVDLVISLAFEEKDNISIKPFPVIRGLATGYDYY